MKLFDHTKDGKLDNNELRYYMCKLGNQMDERDVDEMFQELDKEKTGQIEIQKWVNFAHNVEDPDAKKKKKDAKAPAKKKWYK